MDDLNRRTTIKGLLGLTFGLAGARHGRASAQDEEDEENDEELEIETDVPVEDSSPEAAPPTPTPVPGVTVVAAGLTNPRGFAFAPDGSLAIALAGAGENGAAVVSVGADGCPRRLVGRFPTSKVAFGAPVGFADVAYIDGQLYALLAGGDIDRGVAHNGLYRIGGPQGAALVADLSVFVRDNPVAERPKDFDNDGQPYRLLSLPGERAVLVSEGNSNQVLRVGLDGAVERRADLSAGHPIPTGIAFAPDGGLLVAFFTHRPYREGAAKVVRVAPDGSLSDVWTGLTLVMDLALGPDGKLYAAELATGFGDDEAGIALGTGRIVRQIGPETLEPVATGLTFPSAIRFDSDGALLVATPAFTADNGEGTILRLDLGASLPIALPDVPPGGPDCARI